MRRSSVSKAAPSIVGSRAVTSLPALAALLLQIPAGAGEQPCASVRAALDGVYATLARGDTAAARARRPSTASLEEPACEPLIVLVASAIDGWTAARSAASGGGAPELLAPAREALSALDELKTQAASGAAAAGTQLAVAGAPSARAHPTPRDVLALEIEYAETLVRAAMAAAQDERPEMALLLTHARDLTQRLGERGVRARWPQPLNQAAGELWFEVDRYEDARTAYELAVEAELSAAAIVGLARAHARLGDIERACAIYAQASDASAALRQAAAGDLGKCRGPASASTAVARPNAGGRSWKRMREGRQELREGPRED